MSRIKGTCPICGESTRKEATPFCSNSCKDIDLNRWLTGSYAIPAEEHTVNDDTNNDNQRF